MVAVLSDLNKNIEAAALDERLHEVFVVLEHLLQREKCSAKFGARRIHEFIWNRQKHKLGAEQAFPYPSRSAQSA